ncbi:MAG: hypothetical protein ABH919_00775 [bacterium]
MKKFTFILIIAGLMTLLAPMAIMAQTAPTEVTQCLMRHTLVGFTGFTCPAAGVACPFTSTAFTCGSCCLLDTIYTVTDWVFFLVAALVTIMVLMGGYNLITAAGEPAKVEKGKNYVLWASIGFIVALAAKAIPSVARAILGA